jgi:A/G-specific adenine glycosylase
MQPALSTTDSTMPPPPKPKHLAPRLLAWFSRAKRDLPWRSTRDPYRIWVAEIMLQQTQVDRVIPFYERFLAAFPAMKALAAAPLDDILRLWAGLGYYSRARSLHAACKSLVERRAARFPTSYDEVVSLPGIGAYTAGAILSIAFGQRHPALDANARRVLSRVFHRRSDSPAEARKRVDRLGAAAVPADRPGDYNQALMELGSLVCLPRRPRCDTCCLADICRAHRLGVPGRSSTSPRPKVRRGRAALALVLRRGRVLIAQRPTDGVWGGLWEFPNAGLEPGAEPAPALERLLLSDLGLTASIGPKLGALTYGIMSRRVHLTVYAADRAAGRTKARRHLRTRWVTPSQLAQYALPAPHSRAARMFLSAAMPGSPSDPPPAS